MNQRIRTDHNWRAWIAASALPVLASMMPLAAVFAAPPEPPALAALPGVQRAFLENVGQVAEPVEFYLPGARGTVFVTTGEIVFSLGQPPAPGDERGPSQSMARAVIRQKLVGASSKAVDGIDPLDTATGLIRGGAEGATVDTIARFAGVRLANVYPGIDLECRAGAGGIERTIVLHEDASLDAVSFQYEGVTSIRVTSDGGLELITTLGVIRETAVNVRKADEPDSAARSARYRITGLNTAALEIS